MSTKCVTIGTTWLRNVATLALAAGLAGCVFDGFRLPENLSVDQATAGEPAQHLGTYRFVISGAKTETVYSRFVRVDANHYAWELVATKDGVANYQAVEASFLPLQGGWHALHWRAPFGGAQGVHLVRFTADQMLVAEVSKAQAQIQERTAAPFAAKVSRQFGGGGLVIDAIPADKLLPFLRETARLPGLPVARHERVPQMPTDLRKAIRESMAEAFGEIEWPHVREPGRAARLLAYFRTIHGEGNGAGSYAYARFAANGWGMPANPELARRLAAEAIAGGVPQAHAVLGYLLQAGQGGPADPVAAVQHFRQAAAAGDGRACHGLGLAYLHGLGVAKDPARAVEWFERGSERGAPFAKVALAELLIEGKGIAQNDERAVELLDNAVLGENKVAFQVRAWMYEQGRGGPKDEAAASRLYMRAAQDGLPFSQWRIGERLLSGTGMAQDRKAGRQWLEKAAAAGIDDAKERLAKLEHEGSGAPEGAGSKAPATAEDVDALLKDFDKLADKRIEELQRQAEANRRRIEQRRLEIERVDRERHELMLDMRTQLVEQRERIRLLIGRLDSSRQMVESIDMLIGSLSTTEAAQWQAKRAGEVNQQAQVRQRIAALMGRHPGGLGWRLPDGRVVLMRADGLYFALGSETPMGGIDPGTLPRQGDLPVSGVSLNALVAYEDSWTGASSQDARIVRAVARLNELIGRYACDATFVGGRTVSQRNTKEVGIAAVSIDVNRVLRLAEQHGDSTQNLWFEGEDYIPLVRVGKVELQPKRDKKNCATVVLRCIEEPQQCVTNIVPGSETEVSVSGAVSLSFTDDAKAASAARLLEDLLKLPR